MKKGYRQVIADGRITSSKSFNDYLYAWLVLKADEDRTIWKKDFVYSQVEGELGMTRKTLPKYFNWMVDEGLVIDNGEKWILADLGKNGFWIEEEVLKQLVDSKIRYMVSIYVYLVKGYWMIQKSGKKNLPILLPEVKAYLGLSVNSRSNNYLVTDCFEWLREMGLLNCWLWFNKETGKRFYLLSGIGKSNYF